MRNCDVAEAWAAGRCASTNHLSTDGNALRSYALIIGRTDDYGMKVAYDYTAPKHFASMTTSCHVGLAKQVADQVEEPCSCWHRSG